MTDGDNGLRVMSRLGSALDESSHPRFANPRNICDLIVAQFRLFSWPRITRCRLVAVDGQPVDIIAYCGEFLIGFMASDAPSADVACALTVDVLESKFAVHLKQLADVEAELRDGDRFGFGEVTGGDGATPVATILRAKMSDSFKTAIANVSASIESAVAQAARVGWKVEPSTTVLAKAAVLRSSVSECTEVSAFDIDTAVNQRHSVVVFPNFVGARAPYDRLLLCSPGLRCDMAVNITPCKIPAVVKPVLEALAECEDALLKLLEWAAQKPVDGEL